MTLRRRVGEAVTSSAAVRLFSPAIRGLATVFLLHRFDVDAPSIRTAHSDDLRRVLEFLRRNRHEVVSIEELAHRLIDGRPLAGEVCFTIDDGYLDQAEVGVPLLLEYDVPVTTFLTTGFVDGRVVPWWDQVRHVFERWDRPWPSPLDRVRREHGAIRDMKDLDAPARQAAVERLAADAGVDLLDAPVAPNLPMSWDDARRLEARGARFGAHTETHPLLSDLDDDAAEHEISRSWRRVTEELDQPCPVFAYPNGRTVDFGGREAEVLDRLGLLAAVQVSDTWARVPAPGAVEGGDGVAPRWRIDRIPYPYDAFDAIQVICGMERVVRAVRRSGARLVPRAR